MYGAAKVEADSAAGEVGQQDQLGALGLIVNAIVLYNTIYTQRALDHVAESGQTIDDADIERLSPSGPTTSRSPAATGSRSWRRYATAAATATSTRRRRSRLYPVFRTNSP